MILFYWGLEDWKVCMKSQVSMKRITHRMVTLHQDAVRTHHSCIYVLKASSTHNATGGSESFQTWGLLGGSQAKGLQLHQYINNGLSEWVDPAEVN